MDAVVESGGVKIRKMPRRGCVLRATTSGKAPSQEERKDPPADEGVVARNASGGLNALEEQPISLRRSTRNRTPSKIIQVIRSNPTPTKRSTKARSQLDLPRTRQQVALQEQVSDQQWSSEERSQSEIPRTRQQVVLQEQGLNQQQLPEERSQLELPRTRRQVALQGRGSVQQRSSEERSQFDLPRTRRQVALQEQGSDQQRLSEERSQLDLSCMPQQVVLQGQGLNQKQLSEEQSQFDLQHTRQQVVLQEQGSDQKLLSEEQSQFDLQHTRQQVVLQEQGSDQKLLSEEQSQFDLPRTRQQVVLQEQGSDQKRLSEERSQFDLPRTHQQVVLKEQGSDQQRSSEERSLFDLPRTRQQVVLQDQGSDQKRLSEEQSQFDLPRTRQQVILQEQGSDQKRLSEERSQFDLPRTRQQVVLQEQGSNQKRLSEERSQFDLPRTRQQVILQEQVSDQKRLSEERSQLELPCTPQQVALQEQVSDQKRLSEERSQLELPRTPQQVALQEQVSDQQRLSEERSQFDLPRTCQQVILQEQGSDQKRLSEERSQLELPHTTQQVAPQKQVSDQQRLSEERSQFDLPRTRQQVILQEQGSDQKRLSEERSQLELPHTPQQVAPQKQVSDQQWLSEERSQFDLPRTRQQVIQQEQGSDQKRLSEERSQLELPRTPQQVALQEQVSDQQRLSEERSLFDLPRTRQQVILQEQGSYQKRLSEERSQLELPRTPQQVALQEQVSDQQRLSEERSLFDLPRTHQQVILQEQGSYHKRLSEERSQLELPRTPQQVALQEQVSDQQRLSEERSLFDLPRTCQQVILQEQGSYQKRLSEERSQLELPRTPQQVALQEQVSDQQRLSEERSLFDLPRTHQQVILQNQGSYQKRLSEERSQLELPRTPQQVALQEQVSDRQRLSEERSLFDLPRTHQQVILHDQGSYQKRLSEERSQLELPLTPQQVALQEQVSDQQRLSEERSLFDLPRTHQQVILHDQGSYQKRLSEERSQLELPRTPQQVALQEQVSDQQRLSEERSLFDLPRTHQQVILQDQGSYQKRLSEERSQLELPRTPQQVAPQKQVSDQQRLSEERSQFDYPCMPQQVILQEQGSYQKRLAEERSQEQNLTEENHGTETERGGGGSEDREQAAKQEESKNMQAIQPASQNTTMDTDQFADPAARDRSLAHQRLNVSDRDAPLKEEYVRDGQSSYEEHTPLAQESSDAVGKPIGNQLPVGIGGPHENDTKEIKNTDIYQRLHQETLSSAIDNQIDMLPTAPEVSKARGSMSHTVTPEGQFLDPDVFVPQAPGAFPFKFPYPCQMETACTDSKEAPCRSATLKTKHCRTKHSQGYSLAELSHLHGNHLDCRSQPVFTDHSMQKEFERNDSAVPPRTVSGERSSGMRQIFSGSEQKPTEGLESSYPDADLISAGHNWAIEKVDYVDDRLLPNNATPGPTIMKQARKSVKQAVPGRPLNKMSGITPQTDLPNPNVFDYKTKPEFFDQSSVLNKTNPSPFPTHWPPGGAKSTPTSTSLPLLPQNMSLPSPVPIVCSYSGEGSPSRCGAKKQDVNSYPNDAHSAPPPLEICSNQNKSMRSPSAPVFNRPGTKSPFCCDECTRSGGGVSEKCSNMKSRLCFDRSLDSNTRSNFGQVIHPGPQKPIQSAFTSAQNIPYNDNRSFKKSFCSQSRAAPMCCASSTLVSTSYKPLASVIKNDPSSLCSRNIAKTTCSGASSPCLPPQHTHFMHPKDAHYMHKNAPTFYQTPSVLNAPNRASHNVTYTNPNTNPIPTSYGNNNATIRKPLISSGMPGNNKADRTVCRAPSEDAVNLQHQGYPSVSSFGERRKLTHICSAPNMVTPSYTSSIYTCSSNTATYISSTQSSQSQMRTDSTSGGYSKPPSFPAPPSYAEVIQQKNSIPKNHDLLASQNIGGCKKLLWQPFSDEKPMINIKTEVITGTYPGEVPTSSQVPSSPSAPFDLSVFAEPHPIRQPSASTGQPLQQAVHKKNNMHPMHPPDTCNHPMAKMKVDVKPRLGENGTSVPSGYKQRKVPQREMPPPLHGDNKQVPPWIPKVERNPTDTKNEIKCTFKIKNTEFSDAHFQNAFLNSCPKHTNIPLDKMNRISNALNETTKRIFNNNHPAGNVSGPAPPHGADGRKTPDRKPTIIKTEPQLDPYANGSKMEPESDGDDLFTRLKANRKTEIPLCECLGPGNVPNEAIEGPYYTQLGSGTSVEEIKKMMEERTGLTGKAVRVESIIYSGKEGKSTQGCPIAKWIVRRAGVEEKILCFVRQRPGHFCPTACIVICIVAWEGVPKSAADDMYTYLVPTLTEFGLETDRRCGYNEQKTCACQGMDMKKRGASFSFGCSWSMYFNGCKFARSRDAKRFRLKDQTLDEIAEGKFQNLATRLAPLYKSIAPESYQNQVFFEEAGYECRLGYRTENDEKPCRPFSGVTACVDFCAHAHKDLHNMNNGCTVVVTLTKHGPLERPEEEQLHVLPLYILDVTNEALEEKLKSGCVEILANYPKVARIRATPVIPKRKGKKSKKDGIKKINNKKENALKSLNTKVASHNTPSQVAKNSTPVLSDKFLKATTNISGFNNKNNNLANKANLFQNTGEKNMQLVSSKGEVVTTASSGDNAVANKLPESEKQPPLPANANMYNEFWKYFYSYGTFPPANFLKDGNSADTMRLFASHLADGKPMFPPPLDKSAAALLQHPADNPRRDMPASVIGRPGSACSVPLGNPGIKDLNSPFSVSSLTADDFESPLHLLSEAVMIRSQTSLEKPRPAASHQQAGTSMSTPRKPGPNSELSSMKVAAGKGGVGLVAGSSLHPQLANQAFPNAKVPVEFPQDQHSRFSSIGPQFDQKISFDTTKSCQSRMSSQLQPSTKQTSSQTPLTAETVSRADCPDGCMRDIGPEVIRAELEYNEQNFYDPNIGGVAIALTHGSVLFEVAKRELHATTALLNPNRFSPTRISLVFYQHKSMNLRHHGWYENERKLELQRQKRLQKMQEEAEKSQPIESSELKPGNKKRRKKDEPLPPPVNLAAQYMPMWPTAIKHAITQTTNSIITQWIDPQPTVTGPYQKWI